MESNSVGVYCCNDIIPCSLSHKPVKSLWAEYLFTVCGSVRIFQFHRQSCCQEFFPKFGYDSICFMQSYFMPLPVAGGRNQMIFEGSSSPNHSRIPWKSSLPIALSLCRAFPLPLCGRICVTLKWLLNSCWLQRRHPIAPSLCPISSWLSAPSLLDVPGS